MDLASNLALLLVNIVRVDEVRIVLGTTIFVFGLVGFVGILFFPGVLLDIVQTIRMTHQ
jgi:hypothetical protein